MTKKEARKRKRCNGCGTEGAGLVRLGDGRHVAVCSTCWCGNWGDYVAQQSPVDVEWAAICDPNTGAIK